MKPEHDVIVVGAGPAGATAARLCAKAGLKTLLIEKERFPRYKACGGALSLKTVQLLGFDLGPIIENTIGAAKFTYRLRDPFWVRSESPAPIGFLVMRDRFDQFLVERALEQGIEMLESTKVMRARTAENGIEVELEAGERLTGRYLVGADGAGSVVARSLGLVSSNREGEGFSLQSEIPLEWVRNFPREELHTVHLDFGEVPYGYGWVFPKRECLSVGIGGLFRSGEKINPRQHFMDFVRGLEFCREGKIGKIVGHPLPCFYGEGEPRSKGRVLLVGDAGWFMDPLTGEGIYYAIRSGMLAAEAIIEADQQGDAPSVLYERVVRPFIAEELKWGLHVSRIIYRFTRLSYHTLKRYPELGQLCLQMLSGQKRYEEFVASVKERIKDLLKGRLGEKLRRAMAGS